jgi:hypothetical protein
MKIPSALGLGLFLIILKFLMPGVFSGMANALEAFFILAEGSFQIMELASPNLPASVLPPAR